MAQAAAYLNAMQFSIQMYLSFLRNIEKEVISLLDREFRDGTRYKCSEQSKNAVTANWLISFDQIRRSDSVATDLLFIMSCIENKAIPRSLMPSVESNERMMHAIGTVRAYAFVTKHGDEDSYDLHRLVHLATKRIFPSDDYTNRNVWT